MALRHRILGAVAFGLAMVVGASAAVVAPQVAWADPPAPGGGGHVPEPGGGSGGTPDPCLGTVTASLSVSDSAVYLGAPVTFHWTSNVPGACTAGWTLQGPGVDLNVGTNGSQTVVPETIGTNTWNLWRLNRGIATAVSVTVRPLPQSPGLTVARNADGRLEVVGTDTNDGLYSVAQSYPGGPYPGTFGGGAPVMRSVAAVANADGRMEVIGVNGAGAIFQSVQRSAGVDGALGPGGNGGWTAWSMIGGRLLSIAAARDKDGRVEIFGSNAQGQIWHQAQISPGSDTWSGWQSYDGALRAVAAATNADGRVELFGYNGDGAVYHRAQRVAGSNDWDNWVQLPGRLSAITAARSDDGRLILIGQDQNGFMISSQQTTPGGPDWSAWTTASGGPNYGQFAAATDTDGRVEVVGKDIFGTLYHRAQSAPGGSTWTDWTPIGQPAVPPGPVTCNGYEICLSGDVDGDGLLDAVGFVRSSRTGDPAGNVDVALGVRTAALHGQASTWLDSFCLHQEICELADVNGDHRDDAVAFARSSPVHIGQGTVTGPGYVTVALSTGTGFAPATRWSTAMCPHGESCRLADVNADLRADAISTAGDAITVALSNGTNGFDPPQTWSTTGCGPDDICRLADVNGDRQADTIRLVTTGTNQGQAWVQLSTGTAFGPAQLWTSTSGCIVHVVCAVDDYNGDHLADIVIEPADGQATSAMLVSRSTGTGFLPATSEHIPLTAPPVSNANNDDDGIVACQRLSEMMASLGVLEYTSSISKLGGSESYADFLFIAAAATNIPPVDDTAPIAERRYQENDYLSQASQQFELAVTTVMMANLIASLPPHEGLACGM